MAVGPVGTRLKRLEKRLGLGVQPLPEDDYDAEVVEWQADLRRMKLEIRLGRAPTPEELAVELAREEDLEALDREMCRQRFMIHNPREPTAAELDAAATAYKAELAEEERKRPPGYRRFIGPAAREQIRQMFARELERHRRRREPWPVPFRSGPPVTPQPPDVQGQRRPEPEGAA